MKKSFAYLRVFLLSVAGLLLVLHSFIPHKHHYGNEWNHLSNELKREGLHSGNSYEVHAFAPEGEHSHICHFNPNILLDGPTFVNLIFPETGFLFFPDLHAQILEHFYDDINYDSVLITDRSSRAPPFFMS